jgi:hypothetical protein
LSKVGVHNAVLADLEVDGDLDIYGANWVSNPPVRIWLNKLDPRRDRLRLDRWTVAAAVAIEEPSCTLAIADVDGDGHVDVTGAGVVSPSPLPFP